MKVTIKFNGKDEVWRLSKNTKNYKKAVKFANKRGEKIASRKKLLKKDVETGKTRSELLNEAGIDKWVWCEPRDDDTDWLMDLGTSNIHWGYHNAWLGNGYYVLCCQRGETKCKIAERTQMTKQIDVKELLPLLKPGFVAMDKNQSWWWYNEEPSLDCDLYRIGSSTSKYYALASFDIAPAPDWVKSLHRCGE